MGKIVPFIITILLLNVAMFMFTFAGACPEGGCELEDYNTEVNSTVWEYFTNPIETGEGSEFWNKLFSTTVGIIGTLLGGAVLVGLYLTRDLNIAYITLVMFLVTVSVGTWVRFWILVNNSGLSSNSGGVIALILVGTLIAAQLFYAIDWGRGKD